MKRIILSILGFFCVYSSSAQSTKIDLIEKNLFEADSLFATKNYNDLIKLLEPLENAIRAIDDSNLKFYYYSLLSNGYLCNKEYEKSVQFMEKSSYYNTLDLEDLICAANVSMSEFENYNETKKYARKALIKYYGNNNLEENISNERIGRLLYLLGMSYVNSKDSFMAYECLKIHSALKIEEQNKINQDLKEHLTHLNQTKQTSTPPAAFSTDLIKVEDGIFYSKRNESNNRQDSIQNIRAIKSCETITSDNLEYYLENVLSLDSIYELNQDIYSSKRLLDSVIQNINNVNIALNSIRGISLLVRLGRIYFLFKDNIEALNYFFLAKERYDNTGIHDTTYTTLLQLIANAYLEKDIFWSRLFIEEAIENYQRLYGDIFEQNSSEASSLLLSYAQIIQERDSGDLPEKIYRHILKHCRNSYTILYALNNYGVMLAQQGRIDESIFYYEQIKNFPDVSMITNQIISYINNGDLQNAESSFKKYVAQIINISINSWSSYTSYEIEKWWENTAQEFYRSSNCFADKINSPNSLKYGFDSTIFCKSFPLFYKSAFKSFIEEGDPAANDLIDQIKFYKNKLLRTNKIESDSVYFYHLKIQQLEDSIKIKNSPNLTKYLFDKGFSYKDISNALEKDEVTIEFFEYADLLADSVSVCLAAYIALPNTDTPVLVKLAPIHNFIHTIQNIFVDETELNSLYSKSNSFIYENIWNKLIPYISDKSTIYYSPSGILSLINHNIIHDNNGHMLCDRFTLRRISSTSQISLIKDTNNSYLSATLYGNINYDTNLSSIPEVNDEASTLSDKTRIKDHLIIPQIITRSGWKNLSYTADEIHGIKGIMDSIGIIVSLREGIQASEESLKNTNRQSSDIIHLATHGFTAETYKNNHNYQHAHISYTDHEETLSFHGLLLSGGNNIWLGKPISPNLEDGILTAEEISELDLSKTKLVVLSACNTGQGSIDKLGHVVGLQRAFKLAGVQSILMSLWKVPDESTALLMTNFYKALLNGKNRHQALKIAMNAVSKIYPDPYYWGAFVILD